MTEKNLQDLTDLTSSQLLFKLDEYRALVQKAGAQFIELETLARDLKIKVDATFNEMKRIQIELGKSYNVAKVLAACSEQYKNVVEEQSKAEHEMNMVKIEYDLAKASIKALESISWVRNNELKLGR